MYCKNCGAELAEGELFCANCGTKAGETTPPKTEGSSELKENLGEGAKKVSDSVSTTVSGLQSKAMSTELPPALAKYGDKDITRFGLIASIVSAVLGLFAWIVFAGKDKDPLIADICSSGGAQAIRILWILLIVAAMLGTLFVALLALWRVFAKKSGQTMTAVGVSNLIVFITLCCQFGYPGFIGEFLSTKKAYGASQGFGVIVYAYTIMNQLYYEYPSLTAAILLTLFAVASAVLAGLLYAGGKPQKESE